MAAVRTDWGALLVGTSRSETGLVPLEAVANNLTGLRDVLTARELVAIPHTNVTAVLNPSHPGEVLAPLQQLAESVSDVLFVYFAGHGLLDESGNLHLATTSSSDANLRWSAVKASDVREILRHAAAATRILMLDCCFSGRALQAMSAQESIIAGSLDVAGTVTIASAPPNATALAPLGSTYTAFTGELLSVVNTGNHAIASEYLDVETVFRLTRDRLARQGRPRPQILNQDEAHHIQLTRNAAHQPSPQHQNPAATAEQEPAAQSRQQRPREDRRLSATWWEVQIPRVLAIDDFAFGPDDDWLAVAAGRAVYYYDLHSGTFRKIGEAPRGFLNRVHQVEVSQDGNWVLGLHDKGVAAWATDGTPLPPVPTPAHPNNPARSIRWAQRRNILAVFGHGGRVDVTRLGASARRVEEWRVDLGRGPEALALSPTGTHVAGLEGDTVSLLAVQSGERLWSKHLVAANDDREKGQGNRGRRIAFSHDGQRVAAAGLVAERTFRRAGPGGLVRVWNTLTGDQVCKLAPPDEVDFMSFSPASADLLVVHQKIRGYSVLDVSTGTARAFDAPKAWPTEALTFSAQGGLLGIAAGQGADLWIRGATRDL